MPNVLRVENDDLALLHRHYINLTCIDSGDMARAQCGGDPKRYCFSAFLVDIEGVTVAITAGHIFTDLRAAVEHGGRLSDWAVDDSMLVNHGKPVYPISLDLEKDVLYFFEDGLDYAAYVLHPMAVRAVAENGIIPITIAHWDTEDLREFPFWLLVGLPTLFADLPHTGQAVKSHVTIHVHQLHEKPSTLPEKKHQRLFGQLNFESVEGQEGGFDIGGMSGGPVFALTMPPQGRDYEYRLIALQSGWDRSKYIAMCAAQPFLRALAQRVQARLASN